MVYESLAIGGRAIATFLTRGCQEAFRNSEEDFDFNVKNRLTH
ncbi:hypothetical protein Dxin01_02100 [Deinococcus xinjiangensis]|uniref:Uncharacterized protein n=1 Tax=Deinococcus xinjiangensis TaxID=457454 RepID=A0ABP9VCJ4_9DEIO